MRKELLPLLFYVLTLSACNHNDVSKDAAKFATLKCQIDSIELERKTGKLNFIEAENAKEPFFEDMDVLRRRYRHDRQALDSLIEVKEKEMDCNW